MRKYISRKLAIILSGLTLLLISCTPESCFEETESYLKVTLYKNETGTLQAPDSITVYGLNKETNILYNNTRNTHIANLPLNAETGNCVYIIIINGINDTLELSYSSYPHLVSRECGYTFYHKIDTPYYTTHGIKNIYINNSNITTSNEENIRIFY